MAFQRTQARRTMAAEAQADAEDVEVGARLRVELLVREPHEAEGGGLGVLLLQLLRQGVEAAVVRELEGAQLCVGCVVCVIDVGQSIDRPI
jgi:hypothetical protein